MPKFTKRQKQTIHKVYTTLKKAGFDDISIAGILGNALSESSFDPDSVSKSNYHGLWQNSNDLHNAVINTYGNHNIDTQLRYLIDWTNAHKTVTKGKHRDWLATGAGKFKKSGYKNAQEASDAFMKLYERPVITDKKGNIIGYQKHGERRANSDTMYDYIADTYGIKEKPVIYEDVVKPVDWSQSEKRIVPMDISTPPAKPVHTDVPMKAEAPDMLSMWNSPDSYAYGGTTPRIPDAQEVNSRINHDILNMIGIDPTINKFQIPFAPKYDKGKNATVRTLPRFDDGTPTTVGPYNIYPSALRPTNQDIPYSVTTPEINIYGQDKRPLYQRYDAYGSTYDPNAIRGITDWLPGIGDVSQGLDAYNAFNEGNYLQAGMLGALMFAPNVLEPVTKPIIKAASKVKSSIANLVKGTPSPVYGNGSYSALSRRWEPDELKMLSKNNPVRDLYGTNYDQYPEEIKNSIYNSVYNRMNSLRNDPEFAKDFADAFTEKYTTYSGEPFKKAYGGDFYGGMYFDNTDHIAIRDGNTDYALGHETVHQLDSKLGRIPKEKAFLEDAFDSDFLKGATESERSTTNYDSRKAFLGKMIDSKSSVKTQNEIIDAATDEEVFAAVENANKYGKRYIEEKRKSKKLDHLLAERIKESWKKVGAAAAPMIPAGTALWMEAKDFKKEDLDNSINNLRALVEGVGFYNKKK